MTQEKKVFFLLRIDHVIDLITNSSSELYVIENKTAKETIVEMVNAALKGCTSISVDCIEDHFYNDGSKPYEAEWKINEALELIPEIYREEAKQKYFSTPKYYGIVFDRDWVWEQENKGYDFRGSLNKLGFEMVNGDY